MIPRLHLVTDDEVLARPDFRAVARSLLEATGPSGAFHLRSRRLAAAALYALAAELAPSALRTGTLLLVNDRIDVALGVRAGAHLRAGSIPVKDARRLLHHAALGYSAHELEEAALAVAEGADYVFLGTIYASASHPGRAPAGPALVAAAAPFTGAPLIAIGGVTPERVTEVRDAGAHGVAVIGGIWAAPDPVVAARAYLAALGDTVEAGASA